MTRAWSLVAVLAVALAGACTPPYVEDGREVPPRHPKAGGVNEGPAAGAAGIAFFATQDQMYKAFADLIGGTLSEGARTYSLAVEEEDGGQETARARERLRAFAAESASDEAKREGKRLRRALVDVTEIDSHHFRIHVTCTVDSKREPLHQEIRDGLVTIDDRGQPQLEWLGPPAP